MFTAAVITVSDNGYAGKREDTGGPLVSQILTDAGYDVVYREIVSDDPDMISPRRHHRRHRLFPQGQHPRGNDSRMQSALPRNPRGHESRKPQNNTTRHALPGPGGHKGRHSDSKRPRQPQGCKGRPRRRPAGTEARPRHIERRKARLRDAFLKESLAPLS